MRVLMATDDSSEARQATDWLSAFPLPDDSSVFVVAVATVVDPPSSSVSLSALRQKLRVEASGAADRAAAILRERWPRATTVVAEGDAAVEILHAADEARVDMVVVGARGVGRITRLLGGSTSLAVARYARCAVAVVPDGRRSLRRLLVGLDDSPASRAALAFLSQFALATETSVVLLHVLRDGSPEAPGSSERSMGERLLADASTVLAKRGCSIERMLEAGDAAGEIVRVARERDVDLVVLGARGLRTLGRVFLGSVSEAVLHHAGRAVLVARGHDDANRA